MRFIDDQKEHNRVLFELGLLDDDDDWELYKLQEQRFDMSDEEWSMMKPGSLEWEVSRLPYKKADVGSSPTRPTK